MLGTTKVNILFFLKKESSIYAAHMSHYTQLILYTRQLQYLDSSSGKNIIKIAHEVRGKTAAIFGKPHTLRLCMKPPHLFIFLVYCEKQEETDCFQGP